MELVALGDAGEEPVGRSGLDETLGQHLALKFGDLTVELYGLGVSFLKQTFGAALQTEMPSVEHDGIDVLEDPFKIEIGQNRTNSQFGCSKKISVFQSVDRNLLLARGCRESYDSDRRP